MASIYARGNKLWARLKNEAGVWTSIPTRFVVGEESDARRYIERGQRNIDAKRAAGNTGPLTLRKYIAAWLETRREASHDWTADRGRLNKHVLPVLGDMLIADIRAQHIAELVHGLRFKSDPKLAARTVRNIYSVVAAAFRDATIAGKVDANPCILTEVQLGNIVDKDPEWRPGAVFTREEAEILISHPGIPADRRLGYGFGLLEGMRPGEVGALRFRHWDPVESPLGRLMVARSYSTKGNTLKSTKTETVKTIPVHPTLAAMLAEWRATGWATMMGREPGPEDLILPVPPATIAKRTSRKGTEPHRGYDYSSRRWREVDLPLLGWRGRANYDTKSTFITLAIEDGADPTILRDRVTHTKTKRSAFDGYDRGPHWIATCAEVAKLQISRRPVCYTVATPAENVIDVAALRAPEEGIEPFQAAVALASTTGKNGDPMAQGGRLWNDRVASLATALAAAVLGGFAEQARTLAVEIRDLTEAKPVVTRPTLKAVR